MSEASNTASEPLTWETVARLRAAGSHGTADIAERILHERERHAQKLRVRLWRWLRGL